MKEVEAAVLRVENGFSTRQRETAELTGGYWALNHRQRVKEEKMRREAGFTSTPSNQVNRRRIPVWKVTAKSDSEAEILLYDEIAGFNDENWGFINAKSLINKIKSLGNIQNITLRIKQCGRGCVRGAGNVQLPEESSYEYHGAS